MDNDRFFLENKDALERYEFQMGLERGRLAMTLDMLTDALVLVGQHGVYCQSARQPGKPAMDIDHSRQISGARVVRGDGRIEGKGTLILLCATACLGQWESMGSF